MEIEYALQAKEDLEFWKRTNNIAILKKIRSLIEAILINPYDGIGKPEPLKFKLTNTWSRRINQEHRVVYEITNNTIFILSLKGHY
jgi:toxin YoeB